MMKGTTSIDRQILVSNVSPEDPVGPRDTDNLKERVTNIGG